MSGEKKQRVVVEITYLRPTSGKAARQDLDWILSDYHPFNALPIEERISTWKEKTEKVVCKEFNRVVKRRKWYQFWK